jgi:hypothetical protein
VGRVQLILLKEEQQYILSLCGKSCADMTLFRIVKRIFTL